MYASIDQIFGENEVAAEDEMVALFFKMFQPRHLLVGGEFSRQTILPLLLPVKYIDLQLQPSVVLTGLFCPCSGAQSKYQLSAQMV